MSHISRNHLKLTLEGARTILEAAAEKATEIGAALAIAVVDGGGHLIAFHRMDGARAHAIDIAINKAFTAAISQRPTEFYGKVGAPGGEAFGLHMSNQGRFSIVKGGLPISVEDQVVGGVGCSSGSAEQDNEAAQAGINHLLESLT